MKNQNPMMDSGQSESKPHIQLFTIYDTKTENYSDLICCTLPEFERYADVIVNSHTEQPHHTHPEDFIVYDLGVWDAESGSARLLAEKKIHMVLSAYRKPCKTCKKENKQHG